MVQNRSSTVSKILKIDHAKNKSTVFEVLEKKKKKKFSQGKILSSLSLCNYIMIELNLKKIIKSVFLL